jgi:hypothetical protein
MNRTLERMRCPAGLALILAAALIRPASAQEATGGAPGEWLSNYSNARALGLGGAYVSTADEPLGVLWNPAGLSSMDRNVLAFETARLFEETAIHSFGFAIPGNRLPTFALNVITLQSGEFQRTNELNDDLGTFSEGQTAYMFSASKSFSRRFAVGGTVKLIQQNVEEFSAQGVGFDVGGLWSLTPELRVGGAVMNLGGPSMTLRTTEETYPTGFRGGISYMMLGGRAMMTAEIDQASGPGTQIRAGTEYWIQPTIALRLGFDQDRAAGGFSYRLANQYQMDYGVADHPLGLTHRVGLSYRFGGFFASSQADPPVFSPTGEHAVTKIMLNARTKAEPRDWTLVFHNKSDVIVRRFGGPGQPPAHILWDGKDESGMPLPDGTYRYTLEVHDGQGRTIAGSTHSVEISTSGPQGTVPLVPNP